MSRILAVDWDGRGVESFREEVGVGGSFDLHPQHLARNIIPFLRQHVPHTFKAEGLAHNVDAMTPVAFVNHQGGLVHYMYTVLKYPVKVPWPPPCKTFSVVLHDILVESKNT